MEITDSNRTKSFDTSKLEVLPEYRQYQLADVPSLRLNMYVMIRAILKSTNWISQYQTFMVLQDNKNANINIECIAPFNVQSMSLSVGSVLELVGVVVKAQSYNEYRIINDDSLCIKIERVRSLKEQINEKLMEIESISEANQNSEITTTTTTIIKSGYPLKNQIQKEITLYNTFFKYIWLQAESRSRNFKENISFFAMKDLLLSVQMQHKKPIILVFLEAFLDCGFIKKANNTNENFYIINRSEFSEPIIKAVYSHVKEQQYSTEDAILKEMSLLYPSYNLNAELIFIITTQMLNDSLLIQCNSGQGGGGRGTSKGGSFRIHRRAYYPASSQK